MSRFNKSHKLEKVIILTQARLNSTRFPKKILKKINGESLIEIHLNRLLKSKYSKGLIVATTFEEGIEELLEILLKKSISFFQGSTSNVLDRFYSSVKNLKPSYVVRVTSDCPLIDPILIDQIIDFTLKKQLDYVSNILVESYPDGQDIEVIKFSALEKCYKQAELNSDKEHVTPYIKRNSSFYEKNLFKSLNYKCDYNYNDIRMTVDEEEDYNTIKILIDKIGVESDWRTYANFIMDNPSLFNNQNIKRNQGYYNSLSKD